MDKVAHLCKVEFNVCANLSLGREKDFIYVLICILKFLSLKKILKGPLNSLHPMLTNPKET